MPTVLFTCKIYQTAPFERRNYTHITKKSPSNSTENMSRRWILTGQEGFDVSLKYEQNIEVPSADKLGPHEVLVRMHSASLNYRELIIAGPGVNKS